MSISLGQLSDSIIRIGLLSEHELSDVCHGLQQTGEVVDGERLLVDL